MSVKRIEPKEAAELLAEGWAFVDVRSIPEFEQGHPKGAYSIPLLHFEQGRGMMPNPDFAAVVQAVFGADDKLVLGCRSGRRSLRAAEMLVKVGYSSVVDMRGGYDGERDPAGGVTCPGWVECQLPVTDNAEPGRTYKELEAKKG
jgi:rhodanese-related sulfurtransferase